MNVVSVVITLTLKLLVNTAYVIDVGLNLAKLMMKILMMD
jgi:hypothetical protein